MKTIQITSIPNFPSLKLNCVVEPVLYLEVQGVSMMLDNEGVGEVFDNHTVLTVAFHSSRLMVLVPHKLLE